MNNPKPLGRKSYGSIGHLPGSRTGPADHHMNGGQVAILTIKTRDAKDRVIVQEKLDGSNVGIARIGNEIVALGRAGFTAESSPHEQHRMFARWVEKNKARFLAVLKDGERFCGEWLAMAHGTRYDLPHEPFVVFDLMTGDQRALFEELEVRAKHIDLILPALLASGHRAFSIDLVMGLLGERGHHGALEECEGAVWRVERNGRVDFLAKYVRAGKVDGKYFEEAGQGICVWNRFKEAALEAR